MSLIATRILVVANETSTSPALGEYLLARAAAEPVDVMVVAPAHATRRAVQAAEERLVVSLACLGQQGIRARGFVADAEPLAAARDALRLFDAHEIVVITRPRETSRWLESEVVERARAELPLPVHHLVADDEHALIAA